MSKIKISYSLFSYFDIDNLERHGLSKDKKWIDLSEPEKQKVFDSIKEETSVQIDICDFE